MGKKSRGRPGAATRGQLDAVARSLHDQHDEVTALNAQYTNASIAAASFPPLVPTRPTPQPRSTYQPGRGSSGVQIVGDMPKDPDDGKRPSLIEFGAPGIEVIAGFVHNDEYATSLTNQQWVRMADRMRRSEPMIQQISLVTSMPELAAVRKIAPASPDPQHIEQASFIETCMMHDLEHPWSDVVRQSRLMRDYGYFMFEKVFKIEDGMVKWQKFAPRLPKTILRWWEGPDQDLVGVQQFTWDSTIQNYAYINIPAGKLLRFTYRQEGNNYEGLPMLRPCYPTWWQKQAYLKLQAVGFEREHIGVPIVSLPDSYTDGDIKRAQQIGKNVRSSEVGYLVLPPGWAFEWAKSRSPEKKGGGISDALRYCDLQMQNAYLAGFLSLGQSGTGSYAASTDQSMLLLKLCQTDAAYTDEVVSNDAIPQLVRFNYGKQAMYPRHITQNIQAYALKDLVSALYDAASAGLLRPTVEIEDFLYSVFGIPYTPANLVESTAPGSSNGSRLKPDETGRTPLPLTPEEEIAIANRQTRDIQRVSTEKTTTVGTAADSGNRPRLDAQNSTPSKPKPAGAPGGADMGSMREMPEPYAQYLSENRNQMPISPTQYLIYTRMAREAGRPVIRLTGDYRFESHPDALTRLVEPHPEVSRRLDRRRNVAAQIADGIREQTSALRQELEASVREYVDQATEERDDE